MNINRLSRWCLKVNWFLFSALGTDLIFKFSNFSLKALSWADCIISSGLGLLKFSMATLRVVFGRLQGTKIPRSSLLCFLRAEMMNSATIAVLMYSTSFFIFYDKVCERKIVGLIYAWIVFQETVMVYFFNSLP